MQRGGAGVQLQFTPHVGELLNRNYPLVCVDCDLAGGEEQKQEIGSFMGRYEEGSLWRAGSRYISHGKGLREGEGAGVQGGHLPGGDNDGLVLVERVDQNDFLLGERERAGLPPYEREGVMLPLQEKVLAIPDVEISLPSAFHQLGVEAQKKLLFLNSPLLFPPEGCHGHLSSHKSGDLVLLDRDDLAQKLAQFAVVSCPEDEVGGEEIAGGEECEGGGVGLEKEQVLREPEGARGEVRVVGLGGQLFLGEMVEVQLLEKPKFLPVQGDQAMSVDYLLLEGGRVGLLGGCQGEQVQNQYKYHFKYQSGLDSLTLMLSKVLRRLKSKEVVSSSSPLSLGTDSSDSIFQSSIANTVFLDWRCSLPLSFSFTGRLPSVPSEGFTLCSKRQKCFFLSFPSSKERQRCWVVNLRHLWQMKRQSQSVWLSRAVPTSSGRSKECQILG